MLPETIESRCSLSQKFPYQSRAAWIWDLFVYFSTFPEINTRTLEVLLSHTFLHTLHFFECVFFFVTLPKKLLWASHIAEHKHVFFSSPLLIFILTVDILFHFTQVGQGSFFARSVSCKRIKWDVSYFVIPHFLH